MIFSRIPIAAIALTILGLVPLGVHLPSLGFVLSGPTSEVPIEEDQAERLQAAFDDEIKPILKSACGDCHWGEAANAGYDFEAFKSLEQILNSRRKWEATLLALTHQIMPPEDAEPLDAARRKKVVDWIESTFELVDCSTINPGNVTIRKLNRIEYRHCIADLLGVDYEPAESFPGDDVGHGFDNIADVLSLPPILMEKYLDAAESATQQAIVDPTSARLDISLAGSTFVGGKMTRARNGRLSFLTVDTASKLVRFPCAGKYDVEVTAFGDLAGDELPQMSLLLNDQRVDTVEVEANRLKPAPHNFQLNITRAGEQKVQLRFENDYYVPRAIGRQDRNLHVTGLKIRGPLPLASQPAYLQFTAPLNRASADQFIAEFVSRAFRKPMTEHWQKRFGQLYENSRQQGMSFYEAIQVVAQAVLISPEFLYKLEQPPAPGQIRALDDYERAAALSFFLWSSMPDDQLRGLALKGDLSKPDIWRQQIDRLIRHPKSKAWVEQFVGQWLNLRILADVQPDPELFPTVDRQLLSDMARETHMVVTDIFRRDASIMELLDAKFTYLNERLADHYQIPNVVGEEFRRVEIPLLPRAGILTHASFLTLSSNPTRTSPVKRGKWVMENILGDEPPPPLVNVVPLDEQQQLTGSLRERMKQHRADPSCASCHETMDALGFSFEHFDAVGRFRLNDDGFAIDADSTLPDGTFIQGALGLQNHLKTTYREKFVRCFAEKLLIYALGRGLKYYDRCTVDQIVQHAADHDYRISAFIRAVAESETFLKRSVPAALVPSTKGNLP